MKQCILVVGMHRSGTSLMAGALRILSVNFGEKFLGYDTGNVKGHFEHIDILDADDGILAALGSSWDDPNPLPKGWIDDPRINEFRIKIREIIERDFQYSTLFGLKEPRVSILIPLYRDIFSRMDIEPLFVVMDRPVDEVAESLYARDKMPREKALALCRKYQDAVNQGTVKARLVRVGFDEFLKNPGPAIAKIEQGLSIRLKPFESVRLELMNFIDPGLKHFKEGQVTPETVRNRFTKFVDTVLPFNTRRRRIVKQLTQPFRTKPHTRSGS